MTGINVSSDQGIVDWNAVKYNPHFRSEYAYIKISEGVDIIDPQRALNSKNAISSGIKIGYYHHASLSSLDVLKDSSDGAEYFMKSVTLLPKADLPPAVCVNSNKMALTKNEMCKWIGNFIKIVQKSYPNIVLYSDPAFLNENLHERHGLGNIPLWIAQYTANVAPHLPAGWSDYFMWEYSIKGRINGISGNVGLNRMKTTL